MKIYFQFEEFPTKVGTSQFTLRYFTGVILQKMKYIIFHKKLSARKICKVINDNINVL